VRIFAESEQHDVEELRQFPLVLARRVCRVG
jgi:hypothetical protein